ncbi:MAG: hypothetical protein ACRD2Y_01500 [Terriglobales bacterium]
MTARDWDQEVASAQHDPEIAVLAQSLRDAAERPEGFWRAQRAAVQDRIHSGRQRASLRLAWAGALALVAVAVGLLTQAPAPASVMAVSDPDHDLLVGVDQAVRRPVPQALEPARLLAQELERSADAASQTDSQ